MLLHPDVQRKAQAEVDSVLGTEYDRFPTVAKASRLPYVEACLKECLRWNPPFPNSLAHQVRADDIYAGYYIPKGTIIVPNIW
jgi:cytochrome P450